MKKYNEEEQLHFKDLKQGDKKAFEYFFNKSSHPSLRFRIVKYGSLITPPPLLKQLLMKVDNMGRVGIFYTVGVTVQRMNVLE